MRYQQITSQERCTLATLRKQQRHLSIAAIARIMFRHPSTIARELKRNCCPYDSGFRHIRAQEISDIRRKRSRRKSHFTDQEWQLIERRLKADFSPEQISGTLRRDEVLRRSPFVNLEKTPRLRRSSSRRAERAGRARHWRDPS